MQPRTPRLLLRDFVANDWRAVQGYAADVDPDNKASVRMLEKIGLRCTGQGWQWIKGEQRAVQHFSLSAQEWSGTREEWWWQREQ